MYSLIRSEQFPLFAFLCPPCLSQRDISLWVLEPFSAKKLFDNTPTLSLPHPRFFLKDAIKLVVITHRQDLLADTNLAHIEPEVVLLSIVTPLLAD